MTIETQISTESIRQSAVPCNSVKLIRFFIFNSSFGPREGEEAKRVIYYFSENEDEQDIDKQTKQVGLAEAVLHFSTMFSDMPCESLHTQKTKSVFYQPEPGYVIVMTSSVPCYARKKADSNSTEYIYHPENVHDNVLLAVLKQSYELFCFFTGGFENLAPYENREMFKSRVGRFFSRWISGIHLEQQDVSDLFQAVHFLTLESSSFLQVQSFIHRVEDEFSSIEHCAFFQQGHVVWSGLKQRETALLYHYIHTSLLPATSSRSTSLVKSPLGPFNGHQGYFLTGPKDLQDSEASLIVPKVFIPIVDDDGESKLHECHLIVYHALSATLCMILYSEIELTHNLFSRLDAHLGTRLTHMSADLHNVFGRSPVSSSLANDSLINVGSPQTPLPVTPVGQAGDNDQSIHFLYFNTFNHAMKNTFPQSMPVRGSSQTDCLKQAAHVICDLEADFKRIKARSNHSTNAEVASCEDMTMRLPNEQWIIGKKDGQRQVYALLPSKNSNLVDIGEEVNKLMATEFKNICFLEK